MSVESKMAGYDAPHWNVHDKKGCYSNVWPNSDLGDSEEKQGGTTLVCKKVKFRSSFDEVAFYRWICAINSIEKVEGYDDEIFLHFSSGDVSDQDLRELIGLFCRYKLDMKQLAVFLNDQNKEWFYGAPKGYWHRRVFG